MTFQPKSPDVTKALRNGTRVFAGTHRGRLTIRGTHPARGALWAFRQSPFRPVTRQYPFVKGTPLCGDRTACPVGPGCCPSRPMGKDVGTRPGPPRWPLPAARGSRRSGRVQDRLTGRVPAGHGLWPDRRAGPGVAGYLSGWAQRFAAPSADQARRPYAATLVQIDPSSAPAAAIAAGGSSYDGRLRSCAVSVRAFGHRSSAPGPR